MTNFTLEEAIKYAEKVAEENQRVVDTGIVFDDVTIDMLYCDDTEVIEEQLANYRRWAEEYRQIAEWLKELKRKQESDATYILDHEVKWINERKRKDAIEVIKEVRFDINTKINGTTRFSEALEIAIEALEQKPCKDVISREDALKALCQAVHKNDDNIPCPNQRVSCLWNKTKVQDYAEEILKLPSAIPQQKTGWWIEDAETYYKAIHVMGEPDENTPIFLDDIACSECLVKFSMKDNETKRFKCCPNCGIKMEVKE